MSLNLAAIRESSDEDQLFKLISDELARRFPPKLRQNPTKFLAALAKAPRGPRAIGAAYDPDSSLTDDGLAGHFVNRHDERFLEDTVARLKELEAPEMAEIFLAAWHIVKPHTEEIRQTDWNKKSPWAYFQERGSTIA